MSQVQPQQQAKKRSIIYIDGFNLYYGVLKGSPYKWLNLERFFCRLRDNDLVQRIRYFTAEVNGPVHSSANQREYLLALTTLPAVDVILGKFKSKQVECRVIGCTNPGRRIFTTSEEKRTDVNIALWMLHDAHRDLCDRMILVSGDSDLLPAITMVKDHWPEKEIVVYIPAKDANRGAALELRAVAHRNKTLPLDLLKKSQFPPSVPTGSGQIATKPNDW